MAIAQPQGTLPPYPSRMATLSTLVRRAIKAQPGEPADAATEALAVHYASLIDNAAAGKKYAAALSWLRRAEQLTDEEQHADTIRAALAAHSVASDLGPKLLATLDALKLTPRARITKEGGPGARPIASALDQLAGRRAARRGNAAALDASTP